jgi:hypothetical protein
MIDTITDKLGQLEPARLTLLSLCWIQQWLQIHVYQHVMFTTSNLYSPHGGVYLFLSTAITARFP